MLGDLRCPGDGSQCPNCKSETIEDNRTITFTKAYKFFAICSIFFSYFNEKLALILVVLSIICRIFGKRSNFFDFNDIH
jgi:hypothetical protein